MGNEYMSLGEMPTSVISTTTVHVEYVHTESIQGYTQDTHPYDMTNYAVRHCSVSTVMAP